VSIEWISIVIVVAMVGLMAMGLPLAWSIGAVAVGLVLMKFDPSVMMMLVSRVFDMSMNYTLMSVPLFVLMAGLLQRAGIADQLFRAVNVWSGGLRGGIAVGTIIANAIMASMVGIIGAEIVTFGLIALPEMLSKKYDHKLALGSVAAGGGLATLIPPSVVFIVYGMTAGVSVGELFLAGIMPGLMLGAMFILYVIWRAWRHPESAPLVAEELRSMPVRQKLTTLKELTLPLMITAGVLGSIYTGVAPRRRRPGSACSSRWYPPRSTASSTGPWCATRSTRRCASPACSPGSSSAPRRSSAPTRSRAAPPSSPTPSRRWSWGPGAP
jgi:tripartite ATP-independent transporter DctM subunit